LYDKKNYKNLTNCGKYIVGSTFGNMTNLVRVYPDFSQDKTDFYVFTRECVDDWFTYFIVASSEEQANSLLTDNNNVQHCEDVDCGNFKFCKKVTYISCDYDSVMDTLKTMYNADSAIIYMPKTRTQSMSYSNKTITNLYNYSKNVPTLQLINVKEWSPCVHHLYTVETKRNIITIMLCANRLNLTWYVVYEIIKYYCDSFYIFDSI